MNTMKRIVLAMTALVGGGFFSALQASTIDAIYSFGDSLSDVGNVYAATGGTTPGAPYANGQFSNGNVWVQDLAAGLGLAPLKASLAGGTDYAYGTATTGVTSYNAALPSTDLTGATGQLAQFVATHASADPHALYTIWIGANDLSNILAANPTPSQAAADVATSVANVDDAVNTLAGLGAKNFLIATVPDLGKTPAVTSLGPAASAGASVLSAAFDSTLVGGAGPLPSLSALAAADSIHLSVLDTFGLVDSIVANPSSYGFTNVTDPCLTGEVNYSGGTACATPNQYLFWDDLHPTAAAQEIVATEALALVTPEPATIPEPGTFSLLGGGVLTLLLLRRRRRASRAQSHFA